MTNFRSIGGCAITGRRTRWLALGAPLVCGVVMLTSPPARASTPRATATVVEAIDNEHVGTVVKVLTVTNISTVAVTMIQSGGGTEHVLPAASCKGGEGFVCQLEIAPGASQTMCIASGTGGEYVELTFANGEKETIEPKGGAAVPRCPVGSFASTKGVSAKCVVPKLKGKKLKTAESALKSAHCGVGKVRRATSKHVKKGYVISQSQAAGKSLASGALVSLTVSKGG